MKSIAFPDIFGSSKTNTVSDKAATLSNLKLLLLSDRKSLFGDPFYGTDLKTIIFDNNTPVLKDLIIDDIYTSIQTFMPQLYVSRDNIVLEGDGSYIKASIKAINRLDYTVDLYEINLTSNDET